jgi:hypothetical protein
MIVQQNDSRPPLKGDLLVFRCDSGRIEQRDQLLSEPARMSLPRMPSHVCV